VKYVKWVYVVNKKLKSINVQEEFVNKMYLICHMSSDRVICRFCYYLEIGEGESARSLRGGWERPIFEGGLQCPILEGRELPIVVLRGG